MYLEIDVHRVRLNLCKSGLGAAYRATVLWFEHVAVHFDTQAPRRRKCGACNQRTAERAGLKALLRKRGQGQDVARSPPDRSFVVGHGAFSSAFAVNWSRAPQSMWQVT